MVVVVVPRYFKQQTYSEGGKYFSPVGKISASLNRGTTYLVLYLGASPTPIVIHSKYFTVSDLLYLLNNLLALTKFGRCRSVIESLSFTYTANGKSQI